MTKRKDFSELESFITDHKETIEAQMEVWRQQGLKRANIDMALGDLLPKMGKANGVVFDPKTNMPNGIIAMQLFRNAIGLRIKKGRVKQVLTNGSPVRHFDEDLGNGSNRHLAFNSAEKHVRIIIGSVSEAIGGVRKKYPKLTEDEIALAIQAAFDGKRDCIALQERAALSKLKAVDLDMKEQIAQQLPWS
jgi:hypothetical protein